MTKRILLLLTALLTYVLLFGRSCCAATLPVTDQLLPSGVRLLVQREPDTSLVAIDVFINTAGAPEDAFKPGIANFVAQTLLSGTTNEPQDMIAGQIGGLGGNIAANWDRNATQVRALTLASRFGDTAYLLSDVLKNATLTDGDIQTTRQDLLQALQANSEDVYQQTYTQLKNKLYTGTDIDSSPIGSQAVIASVRPAELRAFYAKYYTADNIVISVVGNVDPETVVKTFNDDLSDFPRRSARRLGTAPAPVVPLPNPVTVKSYRSDTVGGYVMVGYLTPGAGSPDYPEMLLLNALLGGMKTSLLFTDLREKQGLGYDTASMYGDDVGVTDLTGYILSSGDKPAQPAAPGSGAVRTIAAPSAKSEAAMGPSFAGVRSALVDQFRLLREKPPSEQMLARAKRFVTGAYLIHHERLLDRAYWLGFSQTALKPLGGYKFDTNFTDEINAVSVADVQRVAQKYLSDGYVVSMVLPGDPNAGEISR